jgi:hypothetical protein
MIRDYFGTLSIAQDDTTVASHASDNIVDLGVTGRRLVEPLTYVFRIDTAIVSAGGGTLDIQIVTSAGDDLSTPTIIWDSGVLANDVIVAWTANSVPYVIPVLYNGTLLRYFGALYIIGTNVFTAGKWDMLQVVNAPYPQL